MLFGYLPFEALADWEVSLPSYGENKKDMKVIKNNLYEFNEYYKW